jgi:hypothetical protein
MTRTSYESPHCKISSIPLLLPQSCVQTFFSAPVFKHSQTVPCIKEMLLITNNNQQYMPQTLTLHHCMCTLLIVFKFSECPVRNKNITWIARNRSYQPEDNRRTFLSSPVRSVCLHSMVILNEIKVADSAVDSSKGNIQGEFIKKRVGLHCMKWVLLTVEEWIIVKASDMSQNARNELKCIVERTRQSLLSQDPDPWQTVANFLIKYKNLTHFHWIMMWVLFQTS